MPFRKFKCIECGYEEHTDYNASQNIAVKNIDGIITEAIKDGKVEDFTKEMLDRVDGKAG